MAQFVPRVYIHIRDESQRPAAQTIEKALESKGFTVPGIQKVNTGPNKTEVRFFRSSEEDLGKKCSSGASHFRRGCELRKGIRKLSRNPSSSLRTMACSGANYL